MAKFIVYKDAAGEYRWRFRAANGRIIADSGEGYISKKDALGGINFVKRYALGSSIEDTTIQQSLRLGKLVRGVI